MNKVLRVPEGSFGGARIYQCRLNHPEGILLGRYADADLSDACAATAADALQASLTPGPAGFRPSAMSPCFDRIDAPPTGSRKSRWIAVRRRLEAQANKVFRDAP